MNISKKKFAGLTRSELMSRIKSKGNKKTELALLAELKKQKVTGWRRHINLPGKPDFCFPAQRVVIFLDGCFWHGCPAHYKVPVTRSVFWNTKILNNKSRDKKNNRLLRLLGWKVLHFWEHDLTKSKIKKTLIKIKQNLEYGEIA